MSQQTLTAGNAYEAGMAAYTTSGAPAGSKRCWIELEYAFYAWSQRSAGAQKPSDWAEVKAAFRRGWDDAHAKKVGT